MSLFGSLMGDVEDDPFFGSHMRTMRQMNNMMNSLFADPFGMMGGVMGGGPLAIAGPRHHHAGAGSMMPFMPQMPSLDRLFSGTMEQGIGSGSSFTSSTVVMSNGPGGKPQIYSQSSSTKVGPNGIKETRKTLQDSRTGTKKMSIGHHIGSRAHVIEREQNVYSGDAEERQDFINIDEDDAEEFDREFQAKAGALQSRPALRALPPAAPAPAPAPAPAQLSPPLALAATAASFASSPSAPPAPRAPTAPPAPRRPLRGYVSPLASGSAGGAGVRSTYGGAHPQRHRHKHRPHTHAHAHTHAHTHAHRHEH